MIALVHICHNFLKCGKKFLEDEGNFTAEYVNWGEELMNNTEFIRIFRSRNDDGSKMWTFYKITGHKKLPDNDIELKVLWETREETWEIMHTIK